jgi:hypothetical protein
MRLLHGSLRYAGDQDYAPSWVSRIQKEQDAECGSLGYHSKFPNGVLQLGNVTGMGGRCPTLLLEPAYPPVYPRTKVGGQAVYIPDEPFGRDQLHFVVHAVLPNIRYTVSTVKALGARNRTGVRTVSPDLYLRYATESVTGGQGRAGGGG